MQPVKPFDYSKLDTTNSNTLTIRALPEPRDVVTAYGPKLRQSIAFSGPGLTKQSFKDECDINRIMARYQVTGVLPENLQPGAPQYVDVTGIEYQDSMLKIAAAQSLFNQLPAAVRFRFRNDPGEFLDFTQDPDNRDEMIKMGLGRPGAPQTLTPPPTAPDAANRVVDPKDGQTQPLPGVPQPAQNGPN